MRHKTETGKASGYAAKLRDPRWQKKRLEVLSANEFACEMCGDAESTLHVHHKAYIKGREPWEYDANQLAVLCEECHAAVHEAAPDLLANISSRLPLDGPNSRDTVAYLIAGFIGASPEIRCAGDQVLLDVGAKANEAFWAGVHAAAECARAKK